MSILSAHSPHRSDLFRRSMLQADSLPLIELLADPLIDEVIPENNVNFGIADPYVFTPAITLWVMISLFLFIKEWRSCKAAAGRVASLFAQLAGRVVQRNAGNYCRAKAKIPVKAIRQIALAIAQRAQLHPTALDDLTVALDAAEAELRVYSPVIAVVRGRSIHGRILNVDGFTMDTPDTADNQAKFPQNPAQQEG